MDSNSKTSDYTNSVDIWSLGCVIYELLVGTKLFISEGQVSRYFFGKRPFPEDKLKALSPPPDNFGISLLKSMLLIQPEDRPTAAGALSHRWLASPNTGNEDTRGDQDKAAQSRGESTLNRKRKIGLSTHDGRKKRRSEGNPIPQVDARCIPVDVALEANAGLQCGGDPTAPKAIADNCVMTPSDAASVRNSAVQAKPRKPELIPHNPQDAHSKEPKVMRKKKIRNIPQTRPQSSTPNTKPNPLIKCVANRSWMPNSRPRATDSPTPNRYGENNLPSIPETNRGDTTHTKGNAKNLRLHPR